MDGVARAALPRLSWQLWDQRLSITRWPTSRAGTRSGHGIRKELTPTGLCQDSEEEGKHKLCPTLAARPGSQGLDSEEHKGPGQLLHFTLHASNLAWEEPGTGVSASCLLKTYQEPSLHKSYYVSSTWISFSETSVVIFHLLQIKLQSLREILDSLIEIYLVLYCGGYHKQYQLYCGYTSQNVQ